jgi:CRP/FNR family cyclic AMP-dependent transcriptional regulator
VKMLKAISKASLQRSSRGALQIPIAFDTLQTVLLRTLLLLARYGREDQPHGVLPKMSQETLAEMVGTTRSWVNFFMNKFRKLGFIKYNGGLQINTSLLSVVLHE